MSPEAHQYRQVRWTVVGYAGAVVVLGVTLAVMAAWRGWMLAHTAAYHCACGQVLATVGSGTWAVIGGALLIGLAAILVPAGIFLRIVGRARRQQQAWLARREVNAAVPDDVIVVRDDRPFALSAGMHRPLIYCSTELLRRLTALERGVVIAHERAHCRQHDPFWTAIMATARHTFGWLPGMQRWTASAYSLRELCADAVATDNYQYLDHLSSAIVKLAPVSGQDMMVAFSPNADRVEKLLNREWRFPLRVWNGSAAVGVLVVAGMLVGALRMVQAAAPTHPSTGACRDIQRLCVQHNVTTETKVCTASGTCYQVAPGASHELLFTPIQ